MTRSRDMTRPPERGAPLLRVDSLEQIGPKAVWPAFERSNSPSTSCGRRFETCSNTVANKRVNTTYRRNLYFRPCTVQYSSKTPRHSGHFQPDTDAGWFRASATQRLLWHSCRPAALALHRQRGVRGGSRAGVRGWPRFQTSWNISHSHLPASKSHHPTLITRCLPLEPRNPFETSLGSSAD